QAGVLAAGNPVVTDLADTSDFAPGLPISGAGIPDKTTIQSVDGATQITFSQPAALSGPQSVTVGDPINYKPNYPSVMNYTWQLPNGGFSAGWRLDYSHGTYP